MISTDFLQSGNVPYFKVSSDILDISQDDLTWTVESFSVSEKEREFPTVTLSFYDDDGLYSKILDNRYSPRNFFSVEWGWKQENFWFPFSLDEAYGRLSRGPMQCAITNVSVRLENGRVVYQVHLRGLAYRDTDKKSRTWSVGTRGSVIADVAAQLRCTPVINFNTMIQPVTPKAPVMQCQESSPMFLWRLAREWNCKYVIQDYVLGVTMMRALIFVDWSKHSSINLLAQRGLTGQYHYFEYVTNGGNIIDGTLNANYNSVAGGSTFLPVTGPDGKTHIQTTASAGETVVTYQLNPDKVKGKLQSMSTPEQIKYLQDILSSGAQDFPALRDQYFDKIATTTAPEGYGYSAKLNVVLNPLYQIGDLCWLGPPDDLTYSPIPGKFRTKSHSSGLGAFQRSIYRLVSQDVNISGGGFSHSVEIAN